MDLPAAVATRQPNPPEFFLRRGTDILAKIVRVTGFEPVPPAFADVLPLHQTDFTKYRPYSLLALHGFLFRYFPTPPNHIVQMLSELT